MNFKRLLPLFLQIFISTLVLAQNSSVKGVVIDEQTGSGLEYTNIALMNSADSSILGGTFTNPKGEFEFSKLRAGSYILKIVYIGYQNKFQNFNISKSGAVDLGNIILSPGSELLSQVTITGERLNSLNKIDKQSYRADQFESAKGGTAVDVLRNLPSVSVNGEGQISVRGSTGFLVLVNGKPVLTDAQTVLSQLPANSLENIELITSPSAKYDPDGKAGIINIITKKGATDGFTLAANITAGLPTTTSFGNVENPQRYGADLTVNYRKDKWDLSAGINYLRNDNSGRREGDVFTKDFSANTITRFPSDGERSFDKKNYAGRFSAIFTPDTRNSISLGFFSGQRFQSRLADILYNNTRSDLSSGALLSSNTYFNSNLQTKEGNFTLGSLDYTHTFLNKSTLSTSLLYERANLYGNTSNLNLSFPGLSDTIQNVFNPYRNPINGYRLKLDYGVTIGKGKLESGYQLRYDTQDGQFDYFVSPATSQPDTDRFRGSAKAKNIINSVYSQYSVSSEKLDYIAGLRYEYSDRTVNLSYDPLPKKLELSNLFPSASLLYKGIEGVQFKAGYSRRIQRTNNFELNPIPEREHSETLEQGDPNLLPSFIDLYELGLIRNFNKGTLFATLYHQNTKNPLQRVNSVYADTILNRVFTNAERAITYGLELGTNLQPVTWWSLYMGANIYNYEIKGDLNILGVQSQIENADWVYSLNMNSNFNLGSGWNWQTGFNFLSRRPTAQGEDSQFLVPNSSIRKSFLNGRMTAGLQWQNIDLGFLGSQQQRITTYGDDFYTTTNYIYETDVFLLNFSFNLNKLTGKSKLPGSEFGDKEF